MCYNYCACTVSIGYAGCCKVCVCVCVCGRREGGRGKGRERLRTVCAVLYMFKSALNGQLCVNVVGERKGERGKEGEGGGREG